MQALHSILERYSKWTGPPLSEAELVEAAIRFANDENGDAWVQLLLGVRPREKRPPRADPRADESRRDFRAALDEWLSRIELIYADEEERIIQRAQQVLLFPSIRFEFGMQVRHRYIPADLASILDYVVLLIADPSKPYGRDLCRCQLPACGRFFIAQAPKTGRTRRLYCSTEHMQARHDADGTTRSRISRANRKKQLRQRVRPTIKVRRS